MLINGAHNNNSAVDLSRTNDLLCISNLKEMIHSNSFMYFRYLKMRLYVILNATEAVYQWLLFLRGKNGDIVRNRS